MSEFTLEIKATELSKAIMTLASAIGGTQKQLSVLTPETPKAAPVFSPIPVQQTPLQPQRAIPTAVPAAANPTPAPQPVAPISRPAVMQPPIQVPTAAAPTYTYEVLARAASQLMDAGKQQQLVTLLGQFGVQSLMTLPKERYGEFATALRSLGAKL